MPCCFLPADRRKQAATSWSKYFAFIAYAGKCKHYYYYYYYYCGHLGSSNITSASAMGLLGHSPSRPPPQDADTHARDELGEHIRYPDMHKAPGVKHAQDPSYSHTHAASPFGHESTRGQYQEDTAPLVSPGAPRIKSVEVNMLTDDPHCNMVSHRGTGWAWRPGVRQRALQA